MFHSGPEWWTNHVQGNSGKLSQVCGCGFVVEPQDSVQPWFITKPKSVSNVVGPHVLLSCAIARDPFPQYTWTRADRSRPLSLGGDYELLQKEDIISLLIQSTVYRRWFQTFLNP